MTVGEMLARIGSSELTEWAAILDAEDREREKQLKGAERSSRGRGR